MVDLDGALSGKNQNQNAIKDILATTKCSIQLGGGIRSLEKIEEWIKLGVKRVIIGTAAIENETIVEEAIKEFPKKVSVGLDIIDNKVAIKGWTKVIVIETQNFILKSFLI